MKAAVYTKYGSALDVIQVKEVAKPTPKDDEVLLRVHAAGVNAYDWHNVQADPFFTRGLTGIFRPHNTIPGADVAGVVVAVGKAVTQWKPGDEVYGCLEKMAKGGLAAGGFAEYVCIREGQIASKPTSMSFTETAALPMAAVTALQGLRDNGKLKSGQSVLINGASGGVGTYAVQIAKALGAEVTAVCSTGATALVKSLGADHVVDYTKEDFAKSGKRYDLILDNKANRSVAQYRRALRPGGRAAVVGFFGIGFMLGLALFGGKNIGLVMADNTSQKALLDLNELIAAGKLRSVIDSSYPLSQTAAAIHHVQTSHPKGKVVIDASIMREDDAKLGVE